MHFHLCNWTTNSMKWFLLSFRSTIYSSAKKKIHNIFFYSNLGIYYCDYSDISILGQNAKDYDLDPQMVKFTQVMINCVDGSSYLQPTYYLQPSNPILVQPLLYHPPLIRSTHYGSLYYAFFIKIVVFMKLW